MKSKGMHIPPSPRKKPIFNAYMPNTKKPQRFFCLHGHFYQPPREDPCTGKIDLQSSAAPYHDWNERIFEECYAPNTSSRILDDRGRIVALINNFAYMSFNVGPTLFNWIAENHPGTYARILEGDRDSLERLEGHGNALAQVYNHIIMPLATPEQQRLQIKWGVADFEARFGRKPEGMWLAETAINADTVCALIREGIRFTVLSPTQALKVRPLHGEAWTDVSHNSVNPRMPYRIFPVDEDGTPLEKGYLDVFFYDGPLSLGVGFEHLLRDARLFGNRILSAFDHGDASPQLVSVSTDGESYGHHEPFGDMCAAYLFDTLSAKLKMEPVNYGWYLAKFPPQFEVRLKNFSGEGTAWSCAHGVDRWKTDCGCTVGGHEGWNQKWRAPLRQALDKLASATGSVLNRLGPENFRDWEAAKDTAVLGWQGEIHGRKLWLDRHLLPGADPVRALALIDALRFSHFSFTSCAWFFADITGIETLQNLRYALRVLHVLEELSLDTTEIRREFLSTLARAHSNYNGKTGDVLFLELEAETLPLVLCLALDQWTAQFSQEPPECTEAPTWALTFSDQRRIGELTSTAYVFTHQTSGERRTAALLFEGDGIQSESFRYCTLAGENPEAAMDALFANESGDSHPALLRSQPGMHLAAVPLRYLPLDAKERLGAYLNQSFWRGSTGELAAWENRMAGVVSRFQRLDWPLPESIRNAHNLMENFHLVQHLLAGIADDDLQEIQSAFIAAKNLKDKGLKPRLGPARKQLHAYSDKLGKTLSLDPKNINTKMLFALLDLLDSLEIRLSARFRLENFAYPLLKSLQEGARTGVFTLQMEPKEAVFLLDRLNFNTDFAKSLFELNPSSVT